MTHDLTNERADDVERRLSAALHDLTPEPPTTYRFTPSQDASPEGDHLELAPVPIDLGTARRRRLRLGPLLAAAAVVVLGGGIGAAVLADGEDATPPAAQVAPSVAVTPQAPVCADTLVLTMGTPRTTGRTTHVPWRVRNDGTSTCRLRVHASASVAVGPPRAEGTPDPGARTSGAPRFLTLAPRQFVTIDSTLTATGSCRASTGQGEAAKAGQWYLTVYRDTDSGFAYSTSLQLTGCTLTVTGLDVRVGR